MWLYSILLKIKSSTFLHWCQFIYTFYRHNIDTIIIIQNAVRQFIIDLLNNTVSNYFANAQLAFCTRLRYSFVKIRQY